MKTREIEVWYSRELNDVYMPTHPMPGDAIKGKLIIPIEPTRKLVKKTMWYRVLRNPESFISHRLFETKEKALELPKNDYEVEPVGCAEICVEIYEDGV